MDHLDPLDPRSWHDVIGQADARTRLAATVPSPGGAGDGRRDWRARSVLLCGPPGSGKRTLAALYARALLCPHSAPSPCADHGVNEDGSLRRDRVYCRDCRDLERVEHRNLTRLDGQIDGAAVTAALASRPASETMSGGHAVLILERADRLPGDVRDTLGARLRRADPSLTLIVCAADGGALDPELRARLVTVPLDPPGRAERRAFLDRVCTTFEIDPAPTVRDLIAGVASSRIAVRRDVQDLHRRGQLTPDGAAAHYRAAIAPVLAYLRTLAAPTALDAQVAAAEAIAGSPAARIAAIEAALAALFLGEVLRLPDRAGVLGAVPDTDRAALVAGLTGRGRGLGFEARAFWEILIGLFAPGPDAYAATFRVRVTRCDRFLADPRDPPPPARPKRGRPRTRPPPAPRGRGTPRTRGTPRVRGGDHLPVADAQSLWEAGSFLVQAHGVAFNTGIDLLHRPLRFDDGDGVGPSVTALMHALRLRVDRLAGGRGVADTLHAAYVHEHAGSEDPRAGRTRLILHLPPCVAWGAIERWLRQEWLPRHRPGCDPADGLIVQAPSRSTGIDHARHLALLRGLTRSLDPDAPVPGRRGAGAPRLIDVLGVGEGPEARGAIGPRLAGQRKGVSRAIDRGAREAEAETGLPVPSLWEQRAWSLLTGDYALEEHERRRLKLAELDEIARDDPDGDDPAIAAKRERLLARERRDWLAAARARISILEDRARKR